MFAGIEQLTDSPVCGWPFVFGHLRMGRKMGIPLQCTDISSIGQLIIPGISSESDVDEEKQGYIHLYHDRRVLLALMNSIL